MAGVSIVGTILNSILFDLPINIWFSALPGVALGGLFVATFLAVRASLWKVFLFFLYFFGVQFFLGYVYEREQLVAYFFSLLKINMIIAYLVIMDVIIFNASYKKL